MPVTCAVCESIFGLCSTTYKKETELDSSSSSVQVSKTCGGPNTQLCVESPHRSVESPLRSVESPKKSVWSPHKSSRMLIKCNRSVNKLPLRNFQKLHTLCGINFRNAPSLKASSVLGVSCLFLTSLAAVIQITSSKRNRAGNHVEYQTILRRESPAEHLTQLVLSLSVHFATIEGKRNPICLQREINKVTLNLKTFLVLSLLNKMGKPAKDNSASKPGKSNNAQQTTPDNRKRDLQQISPEDIGNETKLTKQSHDESSLQQFEDDILQSDTEEACGYSNEALANNVISNAENQHTSQPKYFSVQPNYPPIGNNILERLNQMEQSQRALMEENQLLKSALKEKMDFGADNTYVKPVTRERRQTSNFNMQQTSNLSMLENQSMQNELSQQPPVPNNIVVKPKDYPNSVISDSDVNDIEVTINNIMDKSRGRLNLKSVSVDEVKYGVMFLHCNAVNEANQLAALITAVPWTKYGLPTLECISVHNFDPAPICEIRIVQKGKTFEEVLQAASSSLDCNTAEWRLIKKTDVPNRRGSTFVFACSRALRDEVRGSRNGEIRFDFGFSHMKAIICIPAGYRTNSKAQAFSCKCNSLIFVSFKMLPALASTSRPKKWIRSSTISFVVKSIKPSNLASSIKYPEVQRNIFSHEFYKMLLLMLPKRNLNFLNKPELIKMFLLFLTSCLVVLMFLSESFQIINDSVNRLRHKCNGMSKDIDAKFIATVVSAEMAERAERSPDSFKLKQTYVKTTMKVYSCNKHSYMDHMKSSVDLNCTKREVFDNG